MLAYWKGLGRSPLRTVQMISKKILLYRKTGLRNAIKLFRLALNISNGECIQYPNRETKLHLRSERTDRIVFEDIFLRGSYDMVFPSEPEFIVDAGANIGLATCYFAHRFPRSQIISIEPESGNYKQLKLNTNRLCDRVTTIQAALWPRSASVIIKPSSSAWSGAWDFWVDECDPKTAGCITTVTLDSIISRSPTGIIDILKIDIEGSEWEVFASDSIQWLTSTRILIVELHRRGGIDIVAHASRLLAPHFTLAGKVGECHVFQNKNLICQ